MMVEGHGSRAGMTWHIFAARSLLLKILHSLNVPVTMDMMGHLSFAPRAPGHVGQTHLGSIRLEGQSLYREQW